jgi:hypothetical protein
MQFMIMHKTNAGWEAGEAPTPELVARVGGMLGGLARAGVLLAGEGLRASREGVRLRFAKGVRTVVPGPFAGENELPAGFTILRTASLDEAVEWATRLAAALGDVEIDIRPVTEPWDIGLAPKPAALETRRYMALRKATADTEAGAEPTDAQRAAIAALVAESERAGQHLVTASLRPSARGRRYKYAQGGISVIDGPFTESKELIAGYVIVSADSLDAAGRLAEEYIRTVGAREVDVREVET